MSAASTSCCAKRCRTTSFSRSCRWCASRSRATRREVRYWYDLLGAINVTFAVCSANGRVLAAIDLDTDRGNSRRILQIKQSVLGACRIRYLRCPVDNLPTAAELQLLVPSSTARRRAARSRARAAARPRRGARLAGEHRRHAARAAHRPLAGLDRVPGLLLRARQPPGRLRQQRVRAHCPRSRAAAVAAPTATTAARAAHRRASTATGGVATTPRSRRRRRRHAARRSRRARATDAARAGARRRCSRWR